MNYSARYVLNPNYRLLDDVKRSLIIAVDKDDEIQSLNIPKVLLLESIRYMRKFYHFLMERKLMKKYYPT